MPKAMSSRERVLMTLARQQADRVPINYSANSGIDKRLKRHFGLADNDDEKLRQRLGVDFHGIWSTYVGKRLHAEIPGMNVDPESGIRTRWVDHGSGGYWDYCDFPLKDADGEAFASWPLPSPDDYDYSGVKDLCKHVRHYAIPVGGAGLGDIMNSTGLLCGMDRMFMGLAMEDEGMLAFIDRRLACQLEQHRRIIEAAAGEVDFMWLGEDLGSQRSALISLDIYRRLIRPRHQKFVDLAKAYGLPVMIHSCGSSSWAFNDFIEMGIDAVDTLQPEAAGMSPAYLKSTFGGRLAFHGCVSTGGAVAFGSVDDVVKEVRATLDIMMPGGGYCCAPTHALQDNSPAENVAAMYATALEYGRYR